MAEHDIEKIVEAGGEVFNFRDPTKQPVADRVTSIRAASSATDTNYPSEKAVRTELDAKATDSAVLHKAGLETASGQKWFEGGFCVFNSGHVGYGHFTLAGTSRGLGYNDWTEEQKDGAHFREWSLSFNTGVNFWGKLRITIATSYSSFNASGSMQKTINCAFNTNTVFNNTGYYNDLGINSEKEFRISDLIWNNTTECWEIKIHSIKPTSNNSVPVLLIEFWTYSTTNRESALGIHWVSTSPSIVTDTTYYTKRSGNASTSPGTGGELFNWADTPVQQSPYGYEIFNRSHTIPVGNGGTGKTSVTAGSYVVGAGTSALVEKTPKDVGSDVLSQLDTDNGNVVDDDYIIGSYHVNDTTISNNLFVRRSAVKLWNYIKSKLSGSNVNIGGNAATAGMADTAKAFDGSFTGTNSIASALNGKSPTTHTHKTDAADVTSDDTNLGDAEDTMQFVTTDAAGYDSSHKPLYRRPALKIWNWIKSKLASDTGYINFAHSVASATNVNSHVLAGVVFADNSLHSCMFTFVMAVTFNFRESDECGGILKVDVGIGTSDFYVKNISLSNVTGALSVGDFNLVVGEVLNRKVVGVTWNGVLKGTRYLRGTILSRYVAGDDTEFVYNDDVANGVTQAWSSARQWADDSAVVHIAGSETITGAKEFSRSGQDTNFTDSSGAESIVRARTATNSNNGSCQLDAYASGGKYGLYARNSGGTGKWVANLDNDGVVNLGSSGDDVRIGGTKFVFGASQLGTDSNTFYWV